MTIRIGLFKLTGTPPTEPGANVHVHVETQLTPDCFVSLGTQQVTELEWASLVEVSAADAKLVEEQTARTQIADSRLNLIFKIHQLAEEYAGPRPIDAQPEQDLEAIEDGIAGAQSERDEYRRERDELREERDRLHKLINTPLTDDFFEAVRIEAAHQVERWGTEHDAGKADADWFWLLGYLGGKALHAAKAEALPRYRHVKRGTTYEVLSVGEDENRRGTNVVVYRGEDDGKIWTRPSDQFFDGRFELLPPKPREKKLHHIITVAAACLNWFRHATGASTAMRPGIEPPVSQPIEEAPMRAAANAAASTTGNG